MRAAEARTAAFSGRSRNGPWGDTDGRRVVDWLPWFLDLGEGGFCMRCKDIRCKMARQRDQAGSADGYGRHNKKNWV